MKISTQIFLGYFLIVGISAFFLYTSFINELRPGVRQATEETLVEMSNLLAELVKEDVVNGDVNGNKITPVIQRFLDIDPNALIWRQQKNSINLRIYITNEKGILLFDSEGRESVGSDYSQWNDVYLTLQGKYGARSTRLVAQDDTSMVMYIAAPITNEGKIIGVLTVGKPSIAVQPYIELAQRNFFRRTLVLVVISLIAGFLISIWLSRSINKLSRYASQVSRGERVQLPNLREQELNQLGQSIELMRSELEGKDYVEEYIHTLTHEMKSPLAAIRGAAELLGEDMDQQQQLKFTQNILNQASRMGEIVARLLRLATVEKRQVLQNIESINLNDLVARVVASKEVALNINPISVKIDVNESVSVMGEEFLLHQAISNLLDNAIDFCSQGGVIVISHDFFGGFHNITITNNGVGIPDYAQDRLFERFYSLPRPDGAEKSFGLGLSFVREIANLHGGEITIGNNLIQGAKAIFTIAR